MCGITFYTDFQAMQWYQALLTSDGNKDSQKAHYPVSQILNELKISKCYIKIL